MIAPLRVALVHEPGPEYTQEAWTAFYGQGKIDRPRAVAEHRAFVEILRGRGVEIERLEEHASLQATATYDPALICDDGAIILRSGRAERRAEAPAMHRKLEKLGVPILGSIDGDGTADAGDTLWLDSDTLLIGRGYRTNDDGIAQLRRLVDGRVMDIRDLELPHWLGAGSVFHLMSVVSLVDQDLAVVYPRAMPIRLMELLLEREFMLIEVPDEEFETQGCNVLALAPRVAVMVAGNARTATALRDAGADVLEYDGGEISIARMSGPTCNTRPLLREY